MSMSSHFQRYYLVLSVTIVLTCSLALLAPCVSAVEGTRGERLALGVGESVVLAVGGALRVAVAEPKVADVAVISRDEVLITARGPGETSLHVWEEQGLRSYLVRVSENTEDVVHEIRNRIGLSGVDVWMHQGTIVLEGWVNSAAERQRAVQVAGAYGRVVDLLDLSMPEPEGVCNGGAVGQDDSTGDQEDVGPEVDVGTFIAELQELVGDPHLVLRVVNGTLLMDGSLTDVQSQERARKLASLYFPQVLDVTRVRGAVMSDKPDLAAQVAAAIDRPGLVVRFAGEKLLLEGALRDQNELTRALHIAGGYASEVVNLVALTQPLQVALQVHVMEIDRTAGGELGVTWGSLNRGVLEPNTFLAGELDMNWRLHRLAFIGAKIQTMVDNGSAHVLAAPTLVAMSGETSQFLAGGEIPVAMPQGDKYVIEWKEYGVRLQAQAVVDSAGYVTVTLTPEVSTLDWANGVRVAGVVMPALRTRRAHTQVRVEHGATLVLGGLLNREDSKQAGKVPFLADLPVLGRLFRSEKFNRGETELLFFVTPQVLREGQVVSPESILDAGPAADRLPEFAN